MLTSLGYLFLVEGTKRIDDFIYWNEFVQMTVINSIFVVMYLYILFKFNAHTEQFRLKKQFSKYKYALKSKN